MNVKCPHCKKSLKAPDSHAGKQGQCPNCKGVFIVSSLTSSTARQPSEQNIPSEIKKNWFGKYQSRYACPSCEEKLISGPDEIGCQISCPSCSTAFVVPGKEQLSAIESQKKREDAEAQEKLELEQRQKEEVADVKRKQEEARRREEQRIQKEIAAHPFDYPIDYTVTSNGMIEYRDQYFEVMQTELRVNPDIDCSDGKFIIKSIRLFKKRVNMTKKENANEIRETKAHFRDSKPRMHKSRSKGLVAGLVNIGVEVSRASHAENFENALEPLEARKELYDQIQLGCDQLIHEVELRMAEN
ncbi:zf-TFIIB domain-containing protein [Adhaeretor mobilis]|uniref:Uncharacterized protein n=1 Tax=Adhaeretor mobilis TaxID=1930276 RepID=A0A517MW15_9BACT|nr:zf-TFIIB domain-containing protein [Adhaeretor mobilis]QDS99059.1 hypothetical protein HG15A2_23490 [Adhaeretor mobilis]